MLGAYVRDATPTVLAGRSRSGAHLLTFAQACSHSSKQFATLREVGVERATVMTSTVARDGPGGGDPIAAWDLPYLRKLYEEFVAGYQPLLNGSATAAWAARRR